MGTDKDTFFDAVPTKKNPCDRLPTKKGSGQVSTNATNKEAPTAKQNTDKRRVQIPLMWYRQMRLIPGGMGYRQTTQTISLKRYRQ